MAVKQSERKNAPADSENGRSPAQTKPVPKQAADLPETLRKPVIFTAEDGETFEFFDDDDNLAHSCALASENALRRIWDTPEEEEGCRRFIAGISS